MPRRNVAERELRQFKDEFERASRENDRAALDRMLHPDFTLVTPEGAIVEKDQLIDTVVAAESNFMGQQFDRSERRTVFYLSGNMAKETADVDIQGNLRGRGSVGGYYFHTATFVRSRAGWQMLSNTIHTPAAGRARAAERSPSGW
jgi:hypothetical protein